MAARFGRFCFIRWRIYGREALGPLWPMRYLVLVGILPPSSQPSVSNAIGGKLSKTQRPMSMWSGDGLLVSFLAFRKSQRAFDRFSLHSCFPIV